MKTFLTFLRNIPKQYIPTVMLISGLMAVVGLAEGFTVVLITPLLEFAFGETDTVDDSGILPAITSWVIKTLATYHISPSLEVILFLIVFIFAIQGIVRFIQLRIQWKLLEKYEKTIIHELFLEFMNTSWNFFVTHKVGHLLNLLGVETRRATAAFQFTLQALAQMFVVLFYVIISLLTSWKITVLGFILGGCASLFLKKFMGKMEEYGAKTSHSNNAFQAISLDMLSGAKLLKSSSTEPKALKMVDAIAKEKVHLGYQTQMNGSMIPSFYLPLVMSMLSGVMYLAITYWGATLPTIIVFVYIFYRLIPVASALHGSYELALTYIPSLEYIEKLKKYAHDHREISGNIQFTSLQKTIVFDRVNLSYGNDDHYALKNVSFTIHRGETIAFVGASGSGKTSIVDLLLGLFTPTSGSIMIDGIPLNNYALSSWRQKVGYLYQDTFLFHASIRDNVTWMVDSASEDHLREALRIAYADEFVREMPKNIKTVIGDRGAKLSGGQRQRIALARLLIKNPEIIIFDEAMSALDSDSEEKITNALYQVLKDKTKIIISHRLSTIKDADRIYVIESGEIAEYGTWDELMAKGGRLARLNQKQII